MDREILRLGRLAREENLQLADGLFELLAAACENCCQEHTGGNKTCPPPPKLAV
jgi:hypothetical protein